MAADKTSRYRAEPSVVAPDARGKVTLAHDSRPLPAVTGSFRHVLSDGERVDQLAEQYYGDPLAWWQICDANPDILSPWELLGHEPVITTGFAITPSDNGSWDTLWTNMFQTLAALPGVEGITVVRADPDDPQQARRILLTYNRLTGPEQLNLVLTDIGCVIEEVTVSTRVGSHIVIPSVEGG